MAISDIWLIPMRFIRSVLANISIQQPENSASLMNVIYSLYTYNVKPVASFVNNATLTARQYSDLKRKPVKESKRQISVQ